MMRRSEPPPYESAAALDMDDSSLEGEGNSNRFSSFNVKSAAATASASGLLKTMKTLDSDHDVEKPPLGTIVLLVNADDEAEMKDLEDTLVPSVVSSVKF